MKAKKKSKNNRSAAVLTLFAVPAMTFSGRRRIAAWLRKQAAAMVAEGAEYAPARFTARYLY